MLSISKSLTVYQFESAASFSSDQLESGAHTTRTRHNTVHCLHRPSQVHHSPHPGRSRVVRLDETNLESFSGFRHHRAFGTQRLPKNYSQLSLKTAAFMGSARHPLAQSIRDSETVATRQPGRPIVYTSSDRPDKVPEGSLLQSPAPIPASCPISVSTRPTFSQYTSAPRKSLQPEPSSPAERASVLQPSKGQPPAHLGGVLYASKAEESGRSLLLQVRQTPTGASTVTTHSARSRRSTVREMELHPHPAVAICTRFMLFRFWLFLHSKTKVLKRLLKA